MPTSHQICMTFQHHEDELCCSFIASKTKISENPIHLFLGLIGLPLREYFTTSSSSSSSSSTISFATAFLSSLTSTFLSPLTPPLTPPLLFRYNRSDNYNRSNKICEESSYTNTSESGVKGIVDNTVVFFLTELLSLLEDSKKSDSTLIFLNFCFSFLIANIFIRS